MRHLKSLTFSAYLILVQSYRSTASRLSGGVHHTTSRRFDFGQSPFSPLLQYSTVCSNMTRGPVIALSHGGGPMPLLGDPAHVDIVKSLQTRAPEILKLGTPEAPRAIILITAHWQERYPTISTADKHPLFFDYYGFPPETYKLKYDAPGSPDVAKEVFKAFEAEGLNPQTDDERGWDHGVFVPMLLVNPAADVPIIQVSVLDGEDPTDHYKMGRALESLRDSNIAIVGSGFASFHNFSPMARRKLGTPEMRQHNDAWSEAVTDAVGDTDPAARQKKLGEWRKFPHSYGMHPQNGGDHFLPLIVCAGAAGREKAKYYHDSFMGLDIYSYYWE